MEVTGAKIIAVSLWRLVIVVSAFAGFWLYFEGYWPSLAALTQQASLLAGVVYLVLLGYPLWSRGRRYEPPTRWVRGALALLMVLVGGAYATLMAGTYDEPRDLLAHLVTPLLVLVDWVAVGSSQTRTRWWQPPSWLALPLAYLVFYLLYGQPIYTFLDPGQPGFAATVATFLVTLLAVGYLLYGLAKLRGLLTR